MHDYIESTQQFKSDNMKQKELESQKWFKQKQKELEKKQEALNQTRISIMKELTELQTKVNELQRECDLKIGQLSLSY